MLSKTIPIDRILRDIGCETEIIEKMTRLHREGNRNGQLAILAKYREKLLSAVHSDEKKIGWLDELAYCIRNDKTIFVGEAK